MKEFTSAVTQIAEEKEIPTEKIFSAIEQAIAAAYKKEHGQKGQIIKCNLDKTSGNLRFYQVQIVVDEDTITEDENDEDKIYFNPERHLKLKEARKINPEIEAGEEIETELEIPQSYGRIAAQTAKQVILQKIREAEREMILSEYKNKEGEIVSGIVQRIEGGNVFMDIGKTLGVMPREEQMMGEYYRPAQRLKVYIMRVEESTKGPTIILSRSFPKLVSKLFELEAPEISSGAVEIKAIARESGSRTKIAVTSEEDGIDPIGAVVGQKGTRVSAVITELNGEKIDVVEYNEDINKFIANALSPAKVVDIEVNEQNEALVIVPDDQISLAIGREGQNVRLASKLVGCKIDVRSAAEAGRNTTPEEDNGDGQEQ